ncbi:MAG: hypothetical protein FWF75_01395 [Propionibacteriaceae bacterium]|nr:hypothetical protein [Propionibacteriaceae bacterium]
MRGRDDSSGAVWLKVLLAHTDQLLPADRIHPDVLVAPRAKTQPRGLR